MARFVMLTRFAPDTLRDPEAFQLVARDVGQQLRTACPGVKWLDSYALLGTFDVLDLFEAPSESTAMQVALLIRSRAGVTTEIYPAVPWATFLCELSALSGGEPCPQEPPD